MLCCKTSRRNHDRSQELSTQITGLRVSFEQLKQDLINLYERLGEKYGVKAHIQLDKYEKRVDECYEKQIRKLEVTYKNIFAALEAQKTT